MFNRQSTSLTNKSYDDFIRKGTARLSSPDQPSHYHPSHLTFGESKAASSERAATTATLLRKLNETTTTPLKHYATELLLDHGNERLDHIFEGLGTSAARGIIALNAVRETEERTQHSIEKGVIESDALFCAALGTGIHLWSERAGYGALTAGVLASGPASPLTATIAAAAGAGAVHISSNAFAEAGEQLCLHLLKP